MKAHNILNLRKFAMFKYCCEKRINGFFNKNKFRFYDKNYNH
jgi:hypothetical protein